RGEPTEAIERFEHAMRLSPLDSEMFRMQLGVSVAHLMARRFDTASTWAWKAHRDAPFFAMPATVIAASCALAGRADEARRAMDDVRKLDPGLRLSALESWLPFRRPEDAALFAEGMRMAGLPD